MADRTSLARATEASEAPTPGYLYLDIAKNAGSNLVACQEVARYLTRRLVSKKNHNVKFKCLKVIAKTAESPLTRGLFKRTLCQDQQAIAAVKEALNFRGPPDPARGDEIYSRVRVAAKEALDAIYADTPSSDAVNNGINMGANTNMGRNSHSSNSNNNTNNNNNNNNNNNTNNTNNNNKRMEGIGNPMFQGARDRQQQYETNNQNMTIGQLAAVAGETVAAMIKDPLAKTVPMPNQQAGGGGGGYGGPNYGNPPGRSQLSSQTNGQWNMASNRGPNAYSGTTSNNANIQSQNSTYYNYSGNQHQNPSITQVPSATQSGVGGTWGGTETGTGTSAQSGASQSRASSHSVPTDSSFAPPTGTGGTAVSDGSYEKNIVLELCPPGGMKAEPPPDKISSFRTAVPSLNPDLVCPAILDTLEEGNPWIMRAKALCVMEVAIQEADKLSSGVNAYADFFHACIEEIQPLTTHPRSAINQPAKRILRLLGVEIVATATAAAVAVLAAAPPPADLLDFDPPAPAQPTGPPLVAPPAPPPTNAPPAPPPTNAPPPLAGTSSLFGGMKVNSTAPTSASVSLPSTNQSEAVEVSLLDVAPTPSTAPSASVPTGGGGLFGDVSVKETSAIATTITTAKEQDLASVAASSGSAFGFINSSASVAAGTQAVEVKPPPPPPPTPPPPSAQQSFDPLLSLGDGLTTPTNTPQMIKPTMQLSPAQMQAMAYQQMMMQQQMQQVQIAMARGGAVGAMSQQQGMPPMVPQGSSNPNKPNVMHVSSHGTQASSSFSFLDVGGQPPKKEDKKFDFVKDAMSSAK